jgi:hypothetical protein
MPESELTRQDITNIIQIHFSYRHIKLWPYEPHKKKIRGIWIVVKNLGYPDGTPDLMGWNVLNGRVYGVEIKTINDVVSDNQKKMHKIMLNDNCEVFIAKELPGKRIELTNLRDKSMEVVYADNR